MPSINSASGMISIWNKDVFVLQNSFSGYEFLGLEGIWKGGNSHITIVNVYSTCDLEGKRILCWKMSKQHHAVQDGVSWMISTQ